MEDITPQLKDEILKDIINRCNAAKTDSVDYKLNQMHFGLSEAFFAMVIKDFQKRGFIELHNQDKSTITPTLTLSGVEFSQNYGFAFEEEKRLLELKRLINELKELDYTGKEETWTNRINLLIQAGTAVLTAVNLNR